MFGLDAYTIVQLLGYTVLAILVLVAAGLIQAILIRFRRPGQAPAPRQPDVSPAPQPDLAHDPDLLRFFARVDPTFRPEHVQQRPRAIPRPEAPPLVIGERPDPELVSSGPDPTPISTRPDPLQLYASPMMDDPIGPARPAGPVAQSPDAGTPAPDAQLRAIQKMWPMLDAGDRKEIYQIALLKLKNKLER